MDIDKVIQGRKSVRHFSDKKPNWRDIIECVDATRYAPMAGNSFSLRFIIVDDEKIIQKLAEAAQQPFVGEAKYVVVVCTDPKLTINAYEERGDKYLRQQAGAAIENMLLAIESKNLKTCWVGYFVDSLIKEALKIPTGIEVEGMFPIGIESKKPGSSIRKKNKININNILFFNKWKNKKMKTPRKIDV
ncbi:MAG: hypothetical protein DRP29_08770 [Thermodesulfobacteriota bacterium]|nr:MAG: hypothetical protein DRP29_08770 [Thermodesulfobacteriota bacterium]